MQQSPSTSSSTAQARKTRLTIGSSSIIPTASKPLPIRYDPQSFPPEPLPSTPSFLPSPDTSFRHYALKLGYPDGIITRVLADLGADAGKEELISHLVKLQDMLCPRDSSQRRRRDATHLPSYMLVQDSYYKGKERMPFWVWVKRETIAVDVTADPPHRRAGIQTRSRSSSSSAPRGSS